MTSRTVTEGTVSRRVGTSETPIAGGPVPIRPSDTVGGRGGLYGVDREEKMIRDVHPKTPVTGVR